MDNDTSRAEALRIANTKALEAYNALTNLVIAMRDAGLTAADIVAFKNGTLEDTRINILTALSKEEGQQ